MGPELEGKLSFIETDVALEPVEKANLGARIPPVDSLLEQIKLRNVLELDVGQSTLSGPTVMSLVSENKIVLHLETRDQHGEFFPVPERSINAKARLVSNGANLPVVLEPQGDGKYDLIISLTDDMAGQQVETTVSG